MQKFKKSILLILTLTLSTTVFSQSNCMTPKWGESIVAFEEDSLFLWIATTDSGLIRYNKQTEVKTYYTTSNSNINSNKILSLLYYNNELILSTDSSLLLFTNNNFTTINDTTKGLMIENLNGDLVIVEREDYFNGAIYTLQNDSIIKQTDICSTAQYCYDNDDLTIDSSGNIWIVRSEFYAFDVSKFDGDNLQSFSHTDFPIASYNNSISSTRNLIVMSNYKGIFTYNGTWEFTTPYDQIISGNDTLNQYISSIELEPNGNLWAGTDSGIFASQPGRIIYCNNGVWEFLPPIDSLPSLITTFHLSKFDSNIVYVGSTNGFMIIDKSCLGLTNIKEELKEETSLIVFPNPSKEVINIQLSGNIRIKNSLLIDVNGKKIKQYGKEAELSTFGLADGLYLLQVFTDKGIITKKVIIE